jgi:hypothetical protein
MNAPRPGGYRDALEKRVAAEAGESNAVRKYPASSRARSAPPGNCRDAAPTKSVSGGARAAWLAKMQTAAENAPVATGGGAAPANRPKKR